MQSQHRTGLESVRDQMAQSLLGAGLAVASDQLTQRLTRVAVLSGLNPVVNVAAQLRRESEAHSSVFQGTGLHEVADLAQVVGCDHRGAGRSDWRSPDEWTLDTWADDVVRLCGLFGIVKPIVLGSSFGGMVAHRYLARHSDHPDRVILAGRSARLDFNLVACRLSHPQNRASGQTPGVIAFTSPPHPVSLRG